MKLFSYPRVILILALLMLFSGLIGVTRLRLPAMQIEKVHVSWDGTVEGESRRGRALDGLIRKELHTLVDNQTMVKRLHQQERVVSISRLWVHRCEVGQKAFKDFVAWYAKQPEDSTKAAIGAPNEPQQWHYASSSSAHRIAGRPQSPASGVSYFDAYAYCQASGGRLPTASEWQVLAGGREGRLYPWGNTFEGRERAWPYRDGALNAAQICGLHPNTDTPEGIHDLANGVLEWSIVEPSPDSTPGANAQTALAHGSLPSKERGRALGALNIIQHELPAHLRSHQVGFRCVYTRQPPRLTPWRTARAVVAIDSGEYLVGLPTDAHLPRLLSVLPAEELRDITLSQDNTWAAWHIDVARCETRRRHYRLFLRDPLVMLGLFANEAEPDNVDYVPEDWARQLDALELPVVGVNWWAADAFARWAGGRLPSSAEWKAVAAGVKRHRYPWGNEYNPQHAMNADLQEASIGMCGNFTQDISDGGVLDLAGNVSEWSKSITADAGGYLMWVAGGSYLLPGKSTAKTQFQRAVPLDHRASDIGFRVVFD